MLPPLTPFHPPWFLRNGQIQTVLGYYRRHRVRWNLPNEDLIVESEPGIRILSRVTWRPGDRAASPALILLHGMGGADDSNYMFSMGRVAYDAGYHVVRANMRGAGRSFEVCARLYNAGLEGDLVAVAREISKTVPRIALFGASLGANHVLLAMGRSRAALPGAVRAAVAVSPPCDLVACSEALHSPRGRVYMRRFAQQLKESYAEVQKRSNGYYEAGREIGIQSVREFDEKITATYGGFASALDYFTKSSSGPWLKDIERPTLIIAAENDPMIPGESIRKWERPASGVIELEMLPTGGHVGFVARTTAPGNFWAAERAMHFFAAHL